MASVRERLGPHPRCLVLCFDGTADKFDGDNTNVVKLFSCLRKDNAQEQMAYYQPGLGTYVSPGVWGGVMSVVAKGLDMAVAFYLEAHVQHGYIYLMNNYRPGDRICLFGFSRGAYTARCLAGMLHKVGLLPKDNQEQVTFAFEMYKRVDEEGLKQSRGFKKTFSRTVDVEFMGAWDTVSSVGSLIPRHLPFTSSNHIIKTFRHAISLDERRSKFNINLWTKQMATDDVRQQELHGPFADEHHRRETITYGRSETDVLEVWFAGTHADVGGGEEKDERVHSLSNISLRWMIREIARSQCGILFDNQRLRELGIPRSLFRLTDAFDNFKYVEQPTYSDSFFGERNARDKFVEEPQGISDGDTTPLIPSAKRVAFEDIALRKLTRRWTGASSPSGSSSPRGTPPPRIARDEPGFSIFTPLRKLTFIPSHQLSIVVPSTVGYFRQLTVAVFPSINALPEPNNHTTDDHYRMTCEELDAEDALEALHDEMMLRKAWLLLELMPMKRMWQERGKWRSSFWPNFGRARHIPSHPTPNIHHTVLKRRAQTDYTPKAKIPRVYNVIE